MAIVVTDWTVDRATGNIMYIGDDHVVHLHLMQQ